MREILFKAKRLDNGEWVEGNLVTRKYADIDKIFEAHIVVDAYEQMNVLNYGAQPVLISPVTIDRFNECCFRVNIDTICQFTGLTDKNGKKIWENDICDRKEEYPEIVKYHEGDFTLDYSYAVGKDYGYNYCNLGFYVCQRKIVEVIGNIFDNPELLEVNK